MHRRGLGTWQDRPWYLRSETSNSYHFGQCSLQKKAFAYKWGQMGKCCLHWQSWWLETKNHAWLGKSTQSHHIRIFLWFQTPWANPESGNENWFSNYFLGRFWKSFGLQIQEIWSRCHRRHSHASRHRRRWKSSQSDHLHQNGSISRSIQTYGNPYIQAWNGQQTGWFRTQQKYWKPISYQFCNFNFHFFLLSLKFWNKSWIRKLCNLFSYFW